MDVEIISTQCGVGGKKEMVGMYLQQKGEIVSLFPSKRE